MINIIETTTEMQNVEKIETNMKQDILESSTQKMNTMNLTEITTNKAFGINVIQDILTTSIQKMSIMNTNKEEDIPKNSHH